MKNLYAIENQKETIASINSKVSYILIDLDFSGNSEYFREAYSIKKISSDKAFFVFDCINHSCTKGYYNLTNEIYNLIKNNEAELKGTLSCDGWQDSRRVGNNNCRARLNYLVRVIYSND